jgi:hypothetical protein
LLVDDRFEGTHNRNLTGLAPKTGIGITILALSR